MKIIKLHTPEFFHIQGGNGAEISGTSSVLDSDCKMEESCSGIPPSHSQLEPRSSVPRTARAGRLKDAAEPASKP
jgi:hypothetical protein